MKDADLDAVESFITHAKLAKEAEPAHDWNLNLNACGSTSAQINFAQPAVFSKTYNAADVLRQSKGT